VLLLVLLVPSHGIAGAGVALCGAYVAMLTVMHLLVRRAFPVTFEWRRLGQLVLVYAGLAVAGELLLPASGFGGFIARAAVFAAMPLVLWSIGFLHRAELDQGVAAIRKLRARMSAA
jgi:O-antigen/teichoic acid export membrane protein